MTAPRKPRKASARKSSKPARDIYQEVTDRIVAALEAGTVPWRKPWNTRTNGRLQNPISGTIYRGVNVWLLTLTAWEHGYSSPYWVTKNQIIEAGGTWSGPGTQVTFWKRLPITEIDEATGQKVTKIIPILKHFWVWNLEQTENVKLPKKIVEAQTAEVTFEHTPIEAAEAIVETYIAKGPSLNTNGTEASYNHVADAISVPPREAYQNLDEYYSTVFHEMGHSTGHADRLARKYGAVFGNHDYGREELVAEMTSAFLQAETGIESAEANSASYLAGWIKTIKEDVRAIVVAAGAAQKATDLILGRPAYGEVAGDATETPEAAEGDLARQAA